MILPITSHYDLKIEWAKTQETTTRGLTVFVCFLFCFVIVCFVFLECCSAPLKVHPIQMSKMIALHTHFFRDLCAEQSFLVLCS